MNKMNKTDSQEFAEILRILLDGAKEKRLSVEEVDTALFTGDRNEFQVILEKARRAINPADNNGIKQH